MGPFAGRTSAYADLCADTVRGEGRLMINELDL
jgi:hypothetical protein